MNERMNEWLCKSSQRKLLRALIRDVHSRWVRVEVGGPTYFSCTVQMNFIFFKRWLMSISDVSERNWQIFRSDS